MKKWSQEFLLFFGRGKIKVVFSVGFSNEHAYSLRIGLFILDTYDGHDIEFLPFPSLVFVL
jgi:hypothetical protein